VGSALDLPFPADSFDVVWMQNVGMNIPDKRKLYAEIYRVLKPGGRYAFQEMAAGKAATAYFPLPWATALPTASLSLAKKCARFSTRADSSPNSSKIPATLI
jgi:ubiquinone/menaquinone biosynthesis C-methylase UbiE